MKLPVGRESGDAPCDDAAIPQDPPVLRLGNRLAHLLDQRPTVPIATTRGGIPTMSTCGRSLNNQQSPCSRPLKTASHVSLSSEDLIAQRCGSDLTASLQNDLARAFLQSDMSHRRQRAKVEPKLLIWRKKIARTLDRKSRGREEHLRNSPRQSIFTILRLPALMLLTVESSQVHE
jgi:hypothetical protein